MCLDLERADFDRDLSGFEALEEKICFRISKKKKIEVWEEKNYHRTSETMKKRDFPSEIA